MLCFECSLLTGVEASAAQNAPVTKTCLQCGSILPRVSGSVLTDPDLERTRACTFCDSHRESPALSASGNPSLHAETDTAWRGEVTQRLASYRARRRKGAPADGQPDLPFEQPSEIVVPGINVAIAEPPPSASVAVSPQDDFSFTIAIGRTAKRPADDAQMFIDVSEPGSADSPAAGEAGASIAPADPDRHQQHSGLYPVASIHERRLAGLIDAACLLFACGGFLALFGSLGGHFALSKLSAAVYAASFAIVYLQYFCLFTIFGGTTPGMMLRGLRVVDFSGEEPTPRQFLLRAAGYLLSAGAFCLGFLWVQWDEDELTWHDRISRTYLSSAETLAGSEFHGVASGH